MPNILVVSAHPDDETFFAGGTIAKLCSEGVRVCVLCATRGQRGNTADVCSIEELPAVREQELRTAMGWLGVTDVQFLPYEDKQLGAAPIEEMRRYLVEAIRRAQPQIVLTFDPHGANQHADHIAISRFVSDAVPAAADERWFPETGAPHQAERLLWQSPVALFELPAEANLPAQPGFDFLIDIRPWAEQKVQAMRAHRTQVRSLSRIFFDNPHYERLISVEAFRVGAGRRPRTAPAPDLFD